MNLDELNKAYRPGSETPQPPTGVVGKFKLWTVSDLINLRAAQWLIQGLLEVGASAVAYGPSGEGKTFVALDWALCVATGRSWQGRPVVQGPVVYVVAEGGRGIRKRVAAWMQENAVAKIKNAFFVLEAVQLRNTADSDLLISRIEAQKLQPALIVIDTFARCFVGGDENTSKDVGEFIDATRILQARTGAAILAVHHTGKVGKQERGSSAMRAAADAMFKIAKTSSGSITIDNDKQKDDEECKTLTCRLKQVKIEGRETETSCVVVADDQASNRPRTNPQTQTALDVLRRLPEATSDGAAWRQAVGIASAKPIRPKTFDNWRSSLIMQGLVEVLEGSPPRYRAITVNPSPAAAHDQANGAPQICQTPVAQ